MKNYPKLYLMRHGQTEWNLIRRMQGRLDSPLTQKGEQQAFVMAQILKQQNLDFNEYDMFASPIGRCQQTANIIKSETDFNPINSDLLKEVDIGRWSGCLTDDILKEHAKLFANKSHGELYFLSPDGESFEDVKARVEQWLVQLKRPTIAVSHGQVGLVIRGIYQEKYGVDILEGSERQDGVYLLDKGKETFLTINP